MIGLPGERGLKFIECFIKNEILKKFGLQFFFFPFPILIGVLGIKRSKKEKREKILNRRNKGKGRKIIENNVNKLFTKCFK